MAQRKVLVIGGGAAGMLSALFAAREGAKVTLLDRNEKLGKKVYITGKGRCNLTNACEEEEFMRAILRNPRFMYAPLAFFNNRDMMKLMEDLGVRLKVERGNRVFPESDHASDVTHALMREMTRLGVEIKLDERIEKLLIEDGVCCGAVSESRGDYRADAVIICTGGESYPSTGSTGDGYTLAQSAGHSIKAPMPALVPIDTRESWPGTLAGLSLKNVALRAYKEGKKRKYFYDEQGEMLFTHTGITGPLVLSLSSRMPEDMSDVHILIDLKPALDEQTLDARLLRDFKEMQNRQITAVMDGLAPHNLGQQVLLLAGISPRQPVNGITKEQRASLVRLIKGLPLTPNALRGFNEAIITRGGVDVKQVNASTMASKLMPGLYFAGEVLDVDAQTGGYNLQIAFSTGALAGFSAARGQA